MANAQACPAKCKEVLDVESKWPYLPLTPTYDQYVQRWVVMPESEGFHLKTRSAMKQLVEDAKYKVLLDKSKKRALFKIRQARPSRDSSHPHSERKDAWS
jgi:hypothetical protein